MIDPQTIKAAQVEDPTLSKVRKYVENHIVHEKKNSKVKWYNKYGLLHREFCTKGIPFEKGIFSAYRSRENSPISDEISS